MLGSVTSAILLLDVETLDQFRFWDVGSLAGRTGDDRRQRGAVHHRRPRPGPRLRPLLNNLALGDDVASGLGQRIGLSRILGAVCIVLLCGAATAAAGPIVFVGLAVPHVARAICRSRLPLDPALLDGAVAGAPARRRHRRPGDRPPGRGAGRHRHRRSSGHPCSSPSCGAASWPSCDLPSTVAPEHPAPVHRAAPAEPARRSSPPAVARAVALIVVASASRSASATSRSRCATSCRRSSAPATSDVRVHRPHAAPAAGAHRDARRRRLRDLRRHLPEPRPQPAGQPRHHRHRRRGQRGGRVLHRRARHVVRASPPPARWSGSLVAALAIYLLAWKGGVSPYRLVLVGIGIAALLVGVTQYLLTRAEIFEAQRAVVWLTGSLNGRSWEPRAHGRPRHARPGPDRRRPARAAEGAAARRRRRQGPRRPRRAHPAGPRHRRRRPGRHGDRRRRAGHLRRLRRRADRPPPHADTRSPRHRRPSWSAHHAGVRPRRPPAVRADRAARGRRHRHRRGAVPAVAAGPVQPGGRADDRDATEHGPPTRTAGDQCPTSPRLPSTRTSALAYDDREVVADLSVDDPVRARSR